MRKIICGRCMGFMDECEEDVESMSEGQMATYESGLWRTYHCSNCNIFTLIEGEFGYADIPGEDEIFENLEIIKELNKEMEKEELIILNSREKLAKKNIIKGDYNEYLCRKFFHAQGLNMIKLVEQKYTANGSGSHILNKSEIMKYCQEFGKEELYDYLCNNSISGLPDFLCINESQIFFVECKCDPNQIKDSQKNKIKELLDLGYEVKLFSTPIELKNISYKPTVIYSIK